MPFSTADPNAYVSLAMQSALGTLNTTPVKYRFAKYAAGNRIVANVQVQDLREGGDGLDFGTTYKVGQTFEGQIVFNHRPEFALQAFAAIPGGATWDGGSAPAVHRFHTGHASHPWSSMQWAYPGTDLIHLIRDVRFLGIGIRSRYGQPIQYTLPFKAVFAGASSNVALVPSYAFDQADLLCHHFAPSIIFGGGADTTIEEYAIDLALGSEDLQAQAVTLDDIAVLNRDVNLTVTRRYENSTMWKTLAYNSGVQPTTAVATTAFSALHQIGGTPTRNVKFDMGLVSLRGDVLTDLDPDGRTIRETFTGKALKLSAASGPFSVTVQSNHASAIVS